MIYITTGVGRFMRPVRYVPLDSVEWLSPFEQMGTDIDLPESKHQ